MSCSRVVRAKRAVPAGVNPRSSYRKAEDEGKDPTTQRDVMNQRGGALEQIKNRFGFLPYGQPIEFEGGSLKPLETFELVAQWINAYRHKDGFVYPHVEKTGRGSLRPGTSGSSLEDFDWEPEPHT